MLAQKLWRMYFRIQRLGLTFLVVNREDKRSNMESSTPIVRGCVQDNSFLLFDATGRKVKLLII